MTKYPLLVFHFFLHRGLFHYKPECECKISCQKFGIYTWQNGSVSKNNSNEAFWKHSSMPNKTSILQRIKIFRHAVPLIRHTSIVLRDLFSYILSRLVL